MVSYIVMSSVLILIVILVRAVLKGRIMLRLQYALWLFVLLRLLVPVEFINSPLSIMNVVSLAAASADKQPENFESRNTVINTAASVAVNTIADMVMNADSNSGKSEGTSIEPEDISDIQNTGAAGVESQLPAPDNNQIYNTAGNNLINVNGNMSANEKVHKPDLRLVILLCWGAVSGILGLVLLVSNIIFRLRLKRTRRKLDITDYPVPVYISNEVPGSCLFGLFKPAVYLTEAAAEKAVQREFILAHEFTHYRHLDHIWSFLRNIVLILHWYNPLVWAAAVLSRRDAELACDEGAVSRLGEQSRLEYGQVLLELSRGRNGKMYLLGFSSATSKTDLKERINMLVYRPCMKKATAILLAIALCVITACTFTGKPEESGGAGESQELNNEKQETETEEIPSETQSEDDMMSEYWEEGELPENQIVELPEYIKNKDFEIANKLYRYFWTPGFGSAEDLDNEYWSSFVFNYYTGDVDYYEYESGYSKVSVSDVETLVHETFGIELTDFYPDKTDDASLFYEDGYYYAAASDFPETSYALIDFQTSGNIMTATFGTTSGYYKIFNLEKADNDLGFIIKAIEYKNIDISNSISDTSKWIKEDYNRQALEWIRDSDLIDNIRAYFLYDIDSNGYPELLIREDNGNLGVYGYEGYFKQLGIVSNVYGTFYENKDGGIIFSDHRGDKVKIYSINLDLDANGCYVPVKEKIYSGKADGYTIPGEPLQLHSIYDISAIENYPWQ